MWLTRWISLRGPIAISAFACGSLLVSAPDLRAQDQIWRWDGESAFNAFGISIAAVGDVDGDGVGDLLIGAPLAGPTGTGKAYVYSGSTGALVRTFAADSTGDSFGAAVGSAGDVDGDGTPDLIVGDPTNDAASNAAGRAYVYSGRSGALLYTFTPAAGSVYFGDAVASAGDVDADGFDDLLVGSEDQNVYVYSGATGGMIYHFTGSATDVAFGDSLGFVGDVDGDGVDDFVIGAFLSDDSFGNVLGKIYVYSGKTGGVIWSQTGNIGSAGGSELGASVTGAGDVDGDGFPDVIAGAPRENGTGKAYVYSGNTGALLFKFKAETGKAGSFGKAVSGAGDVDRDGFADLIVGAPDTSGHGVFGHAYVYSGKTGSLLYLKVGDQASDLFGGAVAGVGDVDGDTSSDVAISAYENDHNGTAAGSVYVLSGIRMPFLRSVTPARTVYNTGLSVTLDGQNFTKGTNTQVLFGAQAASNVVVVDDKTITCNAPTGVPGPVDVTVTNSLGSNTLAQGFDYTPSIRLDGNFVPGGTVTIRYLVICGDETFGIYGLPPPVNLPTPPFFGSLCIFPFLFVPLPPCDPGIQEIDLTGTIPNDPTLSGTQILLQALSGPSITHKPKDAAWTNCAVLEIQ